MIVLTGCSNKEEQINYPIYEGTVVYKEAENNKYKFLVLQNISKEDLANGDSEKFIELAQNQEAAYYYLDKEHYDSIEVGQKVRITADLNQNESNPPIRTALKIDKINE
ncbi:YobA family protein [Paenibacillus polysaccharolyticus]|nr:YobA family protein [Paenibacillus polysaccharolyticus]